MKRKKVRKEALMLFNNEYLERLKKNKFNGRLTASWKDGKIQHCKIIAMVSYFNGRREDADFFMDEF